MTNCRCDPFTGDECQACKNKLLVDKAEYERLKRLEAALPKTADGVPIVPGPESRLWYIHPDSHTIYERSYTADMRDARSHWIGDHQERHDVVWIGVEQCYSTREAAEAAREAEKAQKQ
jgi:hypothetical protein